MEERLKLFLESYGPENVQLSYSTTSKYYAIYRKIFRIADHYAAHPDVDVQILLPINGNDTFIVMVKGGKQFCTFDFNGLKTFIDNYILVHRMANPQLSIKNILKEEAEESEETPEEPDEKPKEEPVEESEVPTDGTVYVWKTNIPLDSPQRAMENDTWSYLTNGHVVPEFPTWRQLSAPTRKQLRDIFKLDIPFSECMQLMKDIIKSTRAPKSIERYIARYQNEHNC